MMLLSALRRCTGTPVRTGPSACGLLRLGAKRESSQTPTAAPLLTVESSLSNAHSVPLRSRAGRGLGVRTWDVSTPEQREKLTANAHLPETLPAATAGLPVVVRLSPSAAAAAAAPLADLAAEARQVIDKHLPVEGAVLLREFPLGSFGAAGDFLTSLGYTMYPDPSGRDQVAPGLYHASLGVPADWNISPHQEHIVSKNPPAKLFLYCQAPSISGGETPLAHAGDVWDMLAQGTREQLRHRRVRFELLRGNAADSENPVRYTRSWQEHFRTQDLQIAIDAASGQFGSVTLDKHSNIIVRSQPLDAFRCVDGRELYRTQLQNIYSLRWLWGDADEDLPEHVLEDIMSAVWGAAQVFQWQAGDLLVVENETVLHGRLSYEGARYMGAGLTRD